MYCFVLWPDGHEMLSFGYFPTFVLEEPFQFLLAGQFEMVLWNKERIFRSLSGKFPTHCIIERWQFLRDGDRSDALVCPLRTGPTTRAMKSFAGLPVMVRNPFLMNTDAQD